MGYKRAGFRVVGNVEIDEKVNAVYVKNNHPKWNFCMDLRDFNKLASLPEELFNLDILDGSPPCSTFSLSGQREKVWGKEKEFREGQKKQVLDDLFFVFLDTVAKLRPKVVIAENVTGILKGNAKGYVNMILKRFKELGYAVQIFQLNSAFMNVPQARERVFFIANRMNFPKLKLNFNEKQICFGEIRSEHGRPVSAETRRLLNNIRPEDKTLSDINKRMKDKNSRFNHLLFHDNKVAGTLTATGTFFRTFDRMKCSEADFRNMQTFPQDYDFQNENVQYICGMSVPPNMIANIATEIFKQWFKKD